MAMMQEFKEFAVKGNVMDLAVGVIIGAAFGKIVESVVGDLVMPVVGAIIGKLDFSNAQVSLLFSVPPHHQVTAAQTHLFSAEEAPGIIRRIAVKAAAEPGVISVRAEIDIVCLKADAGACRKDAGTAQCEHLPQIAGEGLIAVLEDVPNMEGSGAVKVRYPYSEGIEGGRASPTIDVERVEGIGSVDADPAIDKAHDLSVAETIREAGAVDVEAETAGVVAVIRGLDVAGTPLVGIPRSLRSYS